MAEDAGVRIGELARRVGVSADALRVWERRYAVLTPSRSPGGYRLYSPADERRVRQVVALRDGGLPIAHAVAEVMGYPAPAEPAPEAEPGVVAQSFASALERAVRDFDESGSLAAVDGALACLGPGPAIRDVLMPYLRRLGEQWAAGEASVAHEHFASHLVRSRIAVLARSLPRAGRSTAVLGCPPGEEHDIALVAFGVLLTHSGWAVRQLGADVPLTDLGQACAATDPDLVVVSATRPDVLHRSASELGAVAGRWRLALGGPGASARLAGRLGAQLLPGDLLDAVQAVEHLRPARAGAP